MANLKKQTLLGPAITIASGEQNSGVVNIDDGILAGIITPSDIKGLTSVSILHCSTVNGTFTEYKDAQGNPWVITLAVSSTLSINPLNVFGLLPFIKLRGNTTVSGDLVVTPLIAR